MFIVHCILYIIIKLNVKGKRKGDFLNQGSVVQGHYVWQEGLGRDFTSEDAIGREWRYRKLAKFQKLCGSRFLSPQKVAEKWRQKVNCSIFWEEGRGEFRSKDDKIILADNGKMLHDIWPVYFHTKKHGNLPKECANVELE